MPLDLRRAVDAARATVAELGLAADDAIVLHASNRLAVRVVPSDVLVRVAPEGHRAAQFEVDLATRLETTGSPVGTLDARLPPLVHVRDGLALTLWTFYPTRPSTELDPAAYGDALGRLHAGMRRIDLATPHCIDRVREAHGLVANPQRSPSLGKADREVLLAAFDGSSAALSERQADDGLLHGEPHPGNVLNTEEGPRFIDLETCCRGPVEFDLAHAPKAVSDHYPGLDQVLLQACRMVVMAMAAAWRFEPGDQLPKGAQAARELLTALRAGPPYPELRTITGLQ